MSTENSGLTNYRIGEVFISRGVRDCCTRLKMVSTNGELSILMDCRFLIVQSLCLLMFERLASVLEDSGGDFVQM